MTEGRPAGTFISDLRPSRVATLEAVVASLEATREVETKEGMLRKVRNGVLRDATGEIGFVLWGSEVDLVSVGDRVRVVDVWVSDRRGRPQISLGRTGRIERLATGHPEGSKST
jgi:ssDNA-binding replication factor A large subunit